MTQDRKDKVRDFFNTLYAPALDVLGNLQDKEQIRVMQICKNTNGNDFNIVKFFTNTIDLADYVTSKNCYNSNVYYSLATTNGNSGQEKDLKYRYFLAWDFDKKELGQDFSHVDILNRFNSINFCFNALIDSGRGFHVYSCIEPTEDIKLVEDVTNAIANKLGADIKATLKTQVLRVPYTFNLKEKNDRKQVRIVKLYPKETIRPYSIDKLYNRFCCNAKDKQEQEQKQDNRNIEYTLKNNNLFPCIGEKLEKGSKDGFKNKDLQNIVVGLRLKNKSLAQIKAICREWNSKSENSFNENKLNYQVAYMYEHSKFDFSKCKECSNSCFTFTQSYFEYAEKEETIVMVEKYAKDLKHKKRKGSKMLNGNELFIYNVLLNNKDRELNRDDITKLITWKKKKKVAMCEKTLRETLKALVDKEYILVKKGNARLGEQNTYRVNEVKCNADKQFTISYFCTLAVIWDIISTEELRLYTYMRYKHNINEKNGTNIFRINQEELADDLGVTQQRISDMIKNLIDSKILEIWERKISESGFEYYTYRLNK